MYLLTYHNYTHSKNTFIHLLHSDATEDPKKKSRIPTYGAYRWIRGTKPGTLPKEEGSRKMDAVSRFSWFSCAKSGRSGGGYVGKSCLHGGRHVRACICYVRVCGKKDVWVVFCGIFTHRCLRIWLFQSRQVCIGMESR